MVEEEGRTVDERPGEILRAGEALVRDLRIALRGILAELHELRIELDRFLGLGKSATPFEHAWVDGQRHLVFAQREWLLSQILSFGQT